MSRPIVLVTGATGFIGGHLCDALLNLGWEVRVVVRSESRAARLVQQGCQAVVFDLSHSTPERLAEAVEGTQTLFHLAGLVAGTANHLLAVNGLGTERLVKAAATLARPPVTVIVSSVAAVGPCADLPGCNPHTLPHPISDYGRSKLAGERAATRFASQVPISIVRPAIVFGEGDREFIRLFQTMHRTRLNPMIGAGRAPMSLIAVQDLVSLLLTVAERGERIQGENAAGDSEAGKGLYHAADPQPLTSRDLSKIYRETLGHRWVLDLRLPVSVAWTIARISETLDRWLGRNSTLNRDKIREASAQGWILDPTTTIASLDWHPSVPIQQRLSDNLRHALESGKL